MGGLKIMKSIQWDKLGHDKNLIKIIVVFESETNRSKIMQCFNQQWTYQYA